MRIRKLLAFFLSMSLIVCSVPTLVFADETEAAEEGANESKVEEVVETGTEEVIVDGEPAQNGQGGEDGNGDSGDQPIVITPTGDPEITSSPAHFGFCGENASWKLTNNGLLTISGAGDMYDYSSQSLAPWTEFRLEIKTVTISGITNIGNHAFYNCSNLSSITIPNSVTSIGAYAFYGCSSLSSIKIPNRVTSIGLSTFSNCSGLTSITIPNSVTLIDAYAFYGCSSLSSITIPNRVTSIGFSAFSNCSGLTSITIPNSVTFIAAIAFEFCSNLKTIYSYSDPKGCDNYTFMYIPDNTIIYVDGNYLDAYKKKFGDSYNFVDVSQEIDVLGHRVGLGDQIGIDFFMSIPSGVNVDDLSVSFSWGTGNYKKNTSGEFVPTTANGANYIASCAIAARCMTDTVIMIIKKGNTVYATSTFKVVDYAAKVAEKYPAEASSGSDYSNLTYNQKLHTLLLAMLDYGAESQKYFKYRTDDLASNYKGTLVDAESVRSTVNSAYTTYDAATVSSFASKNTIMNIGDDKIGISYAGAAVACTSKTSFKFYFNKADGYDINSLSATYKGKALTFKEDGDSVTLEIAGLSPKEYAPAGTDLYDCSISLTINGKVYTYTYLDYVYKCNNLNHAFKNTAVALAAYSYFAANLEG